ncbi:hypothetical protein [Micrococcus sp. TA1]|uniref:hypothetical protein n=1 Tax=Micrococcus sp. TA1 TaxID=681627 RepID=UPI00161CD7B1|nr:hypothetical protein [Micrococcus sp. TA1]MBB5748523.1 hypothetical protein [Micrococcus sp. TA1]
MSVRSDVLSALQDFTVPYYSHAGKYVAGVTLRNWCEYMSKGNSEIRKQNEDILANQQKILAALEAK